MDTWDKTKVDIALDIAEGGSTITSVIDILQSDLFFFSILYVI